MLRRDRLVSTCADDKLATAAYKSVRLWHYWQIFCLFLTFFLSCSCAFSIGRLNGLGQIGCVLGSNWTYGKVLATSDNSSIYFLDRQNTEWTEGKHCYFVQFEFVAVAIIGFFLFCFYTMIRPYIQAFKFTRMTSSSKLVLPTIVVMIPLAICTFVAACLLSSGIKQWCAKSFGPGKPLQGCENANSIHFGEAQTSRSFFSMAVAAQIFGWLSVVVCILDVLLVCGRLFFHLDFPQYFFDSERKPVIIPAPSIDLFLSGDESEPGSMEPEK